MNIRVGAPPPERNPTLFEPSPDAPARPRPLPSTRPSSRISSRPGTGARSTCRHPARANELVHLEPPARPAIYGDLAEPLPQALRSVLHAQGIERLYSHQARAVDRARPERTSPSRPARRRGSRSPITCRSSSASFSSREANALYLFPTKALAQDQLRGLLRFADLSSTLGRALTAGTYDGDTPRIAPAQASRGASAILTNPDMLHQGSSRITRGGAASSRTFATSWWTRCTPIAASSAPTWRT